MSAQKIERLRERVRTAQRVLHAAVVEEFPKDATIAWDWNGNEQHGTVVVPSSAWWVEPRMKVRNERTGREYWITLGTNHPYRLH